MIFLIWEMLSGTEILSPTLHTDMPKSLLKRMGIIPKGHKVAMFLKLTFLEGKARREMFRVIPPKIVYVSSSRLKCAMNGDFEKPGESATAYAWYIWEKGYKGDTIIKWFN